MKNLFIFLFICTSVKSFAQQALFIPDTLSGTSFTLNVHNDSVQFLSGKKTRTIGINNFAYLGPTLLMNKGDSVSIIVNNLLDDTTTMHWHGLHVAAKNDGGPHTPILPGQGWIPAFTVRNNAATYWYHSHMHGKTGEQALKGQAGMLIVRDSVEAALDLPGHYGVDDFPIVVQTQQFDSVNQILPRGMEDSTMMVNGTQNPYLNIPAQIVRLRLLNADQERCYNFGLSANKSFSIIAGDAGLLNAPVNVTRIQLCPGERAEILIDLNGMSGQTLYLMSYASEIPMGVQGGPTMPMPPGSPPMDSPINGVDFNILQMNVVAQSANPVTTIPATLSVVTPLLAAQAQTNRDISITADSMMVMDGPFYFNGLLFDMMRIDYRIPLNNIETWTLTNQTMVAHPFHIHDVSFFILDRDGNTPLPEEQGAKDVVLVQPNETVRIIMKFTTFADTTTPYVYHCHVLMHEDDGMMGQFIITPPSPSGVFGFPETDGIVLYPNPAKETIALKVKDVDNGKPAQVSVVNTLGQIVFTGSFTEPTIHLNTLSWPRGIYTASVTCNNSTFYKKIAIE